MSKVLSILVPVYNTEKYLRRCLDSMVNESILDDLEIILVNDGSKDTSLEIMKEYKNKYSNSIVLVDKDNGGHGSTINKGLEIATGKYFRVLDSDDWFDTYNFIIYVKKLRTEEADLVVTNYKQEHIYSQKSIKYNYNGLIHDKLYDFNKFNLDDLCGEYFVMATSTYKLSVLRDSGLKMLEKTFYVDMQYNLIGISKVKTFKFYNLDIYRYFIGRKDQSMNLNSFVNHKLDHEKVMKYLVDFYSDTSKKMSNNMKKYCEMVLRYMLYTHYSIFCLYDSNHSDAYKKIKSFDDYLKEKNQKLYNLSDFGLIKYNRKFKFIGVKINGKLFNKMISILKLFKRGV